MKKILIILFTMCFSSFQLINAQSKFKEEFAERVHNNTRFGWGMGGTYSHFTGESRGSICMDLTVFGVYADVAFWTASHSGSVKVDKWKNEPTAFSFHVGYQIPIFNNVRFIPVIGYAKIGRVDVDGYNWHATSSGIVNSTTEVYRQSSFDAGLIVSFATNQKYMYFPRFKANIGATIHQISATIGIEL